MKIIGIEHIGIAINNSDKDSKFWHEVLGLKHLSTEDVEKQGVVTDIYETGETAGEVGRSDPNYLKPTNYQDPRKVRLSATYRF